MRADIYILHTPLHILYAAHILQTRTQQHPALIFITHDFPQSDTFREQTQEFFAPHRVVFTTSYRDEARLRYRWLVHKRAGLKILNHIILLQSVRQMRAASRGLDVDTLFIACDTRPDVQHIIGHYARHAHIAYIEDGTAPYIRHETPPLRQRFEQVQRWLYGPSFVATAQHASHPAINSVWLTMPQAAPEMLRSRVQSMPSFDPVLGEGLSHVFGSDTLLDTLPPEAEFTLICPPLSEVMSAETRAALPRIITAERNRGRIVLLKLHPRESSDQSGIPEGDGVHILPQQIPAELILATLHERLRSLYASFSTILFTAQWVNPRDLPRYYIPGGELLPDRAALLAAGGVQTIQTQDSRK